MYTRMGQLYTLATGLMLSLSLSLSLPLPRQVHGPVVNTGKGHDQASTVSGRHPRCSQGCSLPWERIEYLTPNLRACEYLTFNSRVVKNLTL